MNYTALILHRENGVATITMNRPDKRNAVNDVMLQELVQAAEEVKKEKKDRVLVLTGAGPGFCAGADLDLGVFGMPLSADVKQFMQPINDFILLLREMEKPTIASVNGAAAGVGCNMALACDIVIASETARFGQVFASIGVHMDGGGAYFLPRLVGFHRACELAFTGRIIDAQEAEKIGLINRVVPADMLEKTTKELAGSLAKAAPFAIALLKKSIYLGMGMDLASVLEMEARAQGILIPTEDRKEGVKAFREKRRPEFKGK